MINAAAIALSTLLVTCFAMPSAWAQSKKSGDFYERNYATAPNVGGSVLEGNKIPEPARPTARPTPRRALSGVIMPSLTPAPGDVPLLVIELYVNSNDKTHLARALQGAMKLIEQQKGYISRIVHIGDYRNVDARTRESFLKKHIYIMGMDKLPSNVPSTTSPTWVLTTPDGRYIVEGVMDIDRYITNDGEFELPTKPQWTPTPEAKMEGF